MRSAPGRPALAPPTTRTRPSSGRGQRGRCTILELARSAGPVDESDLIARAEAAIAERGRVQRATLCLAVSGGPRRQVLRPSEIEDPALAEYLMREALFSGDRVLDAGSGTHPSRVSHTLRIEQEHAAISLDESGTFAIEQPALRVPERGAFELEALIEEDILERLARGLRFIATALDHIDELRRLSDVVPVAAILDAGYLPWRTRAEHQRSPTSGTTGMGHASRVLARLEPARRHRAALGLEADRLAQDLTVLLRREIQGGQANY